MLLREELHTAITGSPAIAAIIGDRCYPDKLPEGATFPAVVFITRISEDDSEYRTHDTIPVPRAETRTQVSAYADAGDSAAQLAALLITLLSCYRSDTVGVAQIANRFDTYEPAVNRHRVIIDVLLDYKR